MNDKNSYKQIFKATSIFGGVQVFNILIGIIRSKVSAIFLGVDGVGFVGLYQSIVDLFRNFTGLGINQSAVREISESNSANDNYKVSNTVSTVRFWYWITGILGMLLMIIFSQKLSFYTFHSADKYYYFLILSVVPFFTSINLGQLAVLQGFRRILLLAKANVIGGSIGLVFLVPLYYSLGKEGIIPYFVVSSFISLLVSSYFLKQMKIDTLKKSFKQNFKDGIGIIKLGVMLTLAASLGSFVGYLLRLFINKEGSVVDVGLFTAAFTIIETYIGLVFNAMGTDFYPRLASVNKDNKVVNSIVNHQVEVGLIILCPMIVGMAIFLPFIIKLLYTNSFLSISNMLYWAFAAVFLRATSWPLAYILLAKADIKLFFIKEILSNIYYIVCSCIGYLNWGITGLGIGYLIAYVLNLTQISLIVWIKYNVKLNFTFVKMFAFSVLSYSSVVFVIFKLTNYKYVVSCLVFLFTILFSLYQLERRTDIMTIILGKIFKKK